MSAPLVFYYDVVSPYAYLASLQIDGFARRFGLDVERRPVLLGGLLRAFGAPDDPNRVMSPARTRHTHADIRRQGALHGRTFTVPAEHPRRTLDAMRLVTAAPSERRTAVAGSLFAAYWEQGRDVAARDVLASIAADHGLDVAAIDAPEVKAELRARTDEAAAAGVFGVPSFVHGDLRVWGQDRLGILEDGLRRRGWIPDAPPPDPPWSRSGPASVRFFHDFASPFSYLAATQIERVCAAAGATLEVVPILLGALFRSIGTADVPLFTMHPAKQAWVRRDLDDWAAHWGVGLAFPSQFPIRSVLPLRVALVEPAATAAIYRAAWVDDLPIADPEVLAGVLARAGLPAADLIARADDVAVKAALRRNTEDAVAAGVCGVPSFLVSRADRSDALLWGQDRLPLLAATLAGFDLPA